IVPLAYMLICRPSGLMAFLKKWAGLILLGLAFGSWAIPDSHKHLWTVIGRFRLLGPALLVISEAGLLLYLAYSVRKLLSNDPQVDLVLARSVRRYFGEGTMAALVLFELRMWYYGLFMRRPPQCAGDLHFHYARNDGNASNQAGFLAA